MPTSPWLHRVMRRFRALFRAQQIDNELTDEIRQHVELETEDLMRSRGLACDEAHRQAMIEFGGVQRYREAHRDSRGMRWIEQLAQDVKYAVRSLRKSPGFVVTSVLTIALGIGVTTAVYSVEDRLIVHSLPFAHADRLGLFTLRDLGGHLFQSGTSNALVDWFERAHSFDAYSIIQSHGGFLTAPGHAVVAPGRSVAPTLFRTLGVAPVIGRNFGQADVQPGASRVMMLSARFWHAEFGGSRDVVGMRVSLNDTTYTVIGVVPDVLDAIQRYTPMDFWMPFTPAEMTKLATAEYGVYAIVRLKPGVPRARAEGELKMLFHQYAKGHGWNGKTPLAAPALVQPGALLADNLKTGIWILFGATVLVMLIACANVANLQLIRARRRAGEFAVRAALGAGRGRLVRQLFVEAVALALVASAAGTVLAWGILKILVAYHPQQLVQLNALGFDRGDLAFSLGLAAGTSLLFGVVPAWYATGDRVSGLLRGVTATGRAFRRSLVQGAVVVAEVALSLMLLVGAGLLMRAFVNLDSADPGFKPNGLVELTVWLPPAQYADSTSQQAFLNRVVIRARAVPGVEAAMVATSTMLRSNTFTWRPADLAIDGAQGVQTLAKEEVDVRYVSPGYFRLLGTSLVAGRAFEFADDQNGGAAVAVIGKGLARRLWPDMPAIGQRFRLDAKSPWLTVVGVTPDIGLVGVPLDLANAQLQVYRPASAVKEATNLWGAPGVIARAAPGASDAAILASLEKIIRSEDPAVPTNNASSESAILGERLATPKFNSLLMAAFSIMALLLACIGLYGVIAYAVSQRTHEIGVRIALGARSRDVSRLIVGSGARLSLIGIVLGLAGGLAGVRLLKSVLYGVSPTDPVVFITIPLLLLGAGLLASYLPARRAARVDPVIALRAE